MVILLWLSEQPTEEYRKRQMNPVFKIILICHSWFIQTASSPFCVVTSPPNCNLCWIPSLAERWQIVMPLLCDVHVWKYWLSDEPAVTPDLWFTSLFIRFFLWWSVSHAEIKHSVYSLAEVKYLYMDIYIDCFCHNIHAEPWCTWHIQSSSHLLPCCFICRLQITSVWPTFSKERLGVCVLKATDCAQCPVCPVQLWHTRHYFTLTTLWKWTSF